MTQDFTFFAGPETGLLKVDLSPLHDKIAALEAELAAEKHEREHAQAQWRVAKLLLEEEKFRRAAAAHAAAPVFLDGANIVINGVPFVAGEGDAFEASVSRAYDSQTNYRIVVRRL